MEINRYFIYKFMKWVKMFYCIFFLFLNHNMDGHVVGVFFSSHFSAIYDL